MGHLIMNNSKELLSVVLILLMCFPMNAIPVTAHIAEVVTDVSGVYLDSVEYVLIEDDSQRVLSLQNGSIDMIVGYLPSHYNDDLLETDDVIVETQLRYGYEQMIVNCLKYPLNESSFRRALAQAFNKTALTEPYAAIYSPNDTELLLHDVLLPRINPYTAEGNLPSRYYDQDILLANQTLDEGGFLDNDGDGWREAPDGSDFSIYIEAPAFSYFLSLGSIIEDTLSKIGIEGYFLPTDFLTYEDTLVSHENFDIKFWRTDFILGEFSVIPPNSQTLDMEFLRRHTSDNYLLHNLNPCNWKNSTYDYWVSVFFNTSSEVQRQTAALEIQKIWFEECPSIIIHSLAEAVGYRTDRLQDLHVNTSGEFVFPWSSYLARLMNEEGGPIGGTLRIGYGNEIETFNYMKAGQRYGTIGLKESSRDILEHIQLTLVNLDKNCEYIPWLAESYTIENNDDNPSIPVGKSRITFQLREDAKWSNGTQITADDVSYSLTYYAQSAQYGNPIGTVFNQMTAVYSPLPLTVLVEFDVPYCYLDLSAFAVANIVPQGTFDGIDYSDWEDWNPILGADNFPMGGPFILDSHTPGERTVLTVNPYFFNLAERTTPAAITSAQDISFDEGSQGHAIQWNITGAYSGTYEIYRNQSVIDDGGWDGESIVFNLDGLTVGIHNFTLVIEDFYGMTSQDTVIVTVSNTTTVSSGGLSELPLIAIGGVAVIVVVAGTFFVKKKR